MDNTLIMTMTWVDSRALECLKKKSQSQKAIFLNYATYGTVTVMWNRLVTDERQTGMKEGYL